MDGWWFNLNFFLNEKNSKDIESSIFNFSQEFAEINDTPYLIQQIYDSKVDEIMCHLSIKQSFLVKAIKDKKIDAYNLYNILIGGVPLSIHNDILNDSEECIVDYEKSLDNIISTDKETDRKKCIYYNYLYYLKNISKYESLKHNLKNTLIAILSLATLSVIIIILCIN